MLLKQVFIHPQNHVSSDWVILSMLNPASGRRQTAWALVGRMPRVTMQLAMTPSRSSESALDSRAFAAWGWVKWVFLTVISLHHDALDCALLPHETRALPGMLCAA